jgi:hypothetical protein
MEKFFKGHFQYPRILYCQGKFQSPPLWESLEKNLVTQALAQNQHISLVGGTW